MPSHLSGSQPPMICKSQIVEAAMVIVNDDPDLSVVMRLLEGIAREAYVAGVNFAVSRLESVPEIQGDDG